MQAWLFRAPCHMSIPTFLCTTCILTKIYFVQGQLSGLLNQEKPEAEMRGRVIPCQITFLGPNDSLGGGANCPETLRNFEPGWPEQFNIAYVVQGI